MQNKYITQKTKRPLNETKSTRFQPSNNYQFQTSNYFQDDFQDREEIGDHFLKHEAECEVCDYVEAFKNLDREKFKEMFIFSELISKPLSMRKKNNKK